MPDVYFTSRDGARALANGHRRPTIHISRDGATLCRASALIKHRIETPESSVTEWNLCNTCEGHAAPAKVRCRAITARGTQCPRPVGYRLPDLCGTHDRMFALGRLRELALPGRPLPKTIHVLVEQDG